MKTKISTAIVLALLCQSCTSLSSSPSDKKDKYLQVIDPEDNADAKLDAQKIDHFCDEEILSDNKLHKVCYVEETIAQKIDRFKDIVPIPKPKEIIIGAGKAVAAVGYIILQSSAGYHN